MIPIRAAVEKHCAQRAFRMDSEHWNKLKRLMAAMAAVCRTARSAAKKRDGNLERVRAALRALDEIK